MLLLCLLVAEAVGNVFTSTVVESVVCRCLGFPFAEQCSFFAQALH